MGLKEWKQTTTPPLRARLVRTTSSKCSTDGLTQYLGVSLILRSALNVVFEQDFYGNGDVAHLGGAQW
jgi:hypothetical protein